MTFNRYVLPNREKEKRDQVKKNNGYGIETDKDELMTFGGTDKVCRLIKNENNTTKMPNIV